MRFPILAKMLMLLIVLAVLPLAIFGILALNDIHALQAGAVTQIDGMKTVAVSDSTSSLNALGESIIEQKAIDVAKQLEIYIKDHPTMTVAQLQADPVFSALAVQPVGKTGYTAVTDVDTLICRFHASPKIVNMDLHNLAKALPGFWSVMSRSQGGKEAMGYYDWLEPDNTTKQKYMYIAIVNATTADGVRFSVASTTYIDEFSAPSQQLEQKMAATRQTVVQEIDSRAADIRSKTYLFLVIVLVIVIVAALLFAQSLTRPIKQLTDAGNRIADGQLDTEMPVFRTNDEIKDLSGTMNLLVGAIRFMKQETAEKTATKTTGKPPKK